MNKAPAAPVKLTMVESTATEPLPTSRAKVNLVMLAQISENEVVQESIIGAEVVESDFDEETNIFTLKAKVPDPSTYRDDKTFSWKQMSKKQEEGVEITRQLNVQEFRLKKQMESSRPAPANLDNITVKP